MNFETVGQQTYGRIEWVGEWSGPFEVGPQTYDFDMSVVITPECPVRPRTIPRPRQPLVVPRFLVGFDDGTVITMNSKSVRKLVNACFAGNRIGDYAGSSLAPRFGDLFRECVGCYVIATRTVLSGHHNVLKFERASPPASSWAA